MKTSIKNTAPLIGIARHRLATDGEGVSTLVAFHGCPLRCRYCLNPQSLGPAERCKCYDPASLYQMTKTDELYFLATCGGVTFGGGEPALQSDFITRFRELCGTEWLLTLETSLNVPASHILRLLPVVDRYIIDVKDMNPDIYRRYTGRENKTVRQNLRLLVRHGRTGNVTLRLPLIPNYNTEEDRKRSREELEAMGFTRFDLLTYQTFNTPTP